MTLEITCIGNHFSSTNYVISLYKKHSQNTPQIIIEETKTSNIMKKLPMLFRSKSEEITELFTVSEDSTEYFDVETPSEPSV